jgi:two-component system, LytTR family, response regulator
MTHDHHPRNPQSRTPVRTLIVDDESLIRRGLRDRLGEIDGIEVVAECENGAEAVERILSEEIDLVLLDVQMPDIDGLEVVRQVGPERMPLVIFVTAYDEYALRAFELNAVDYLLKPFDEERLRQSIARASEKLNQQDQKALIERLQTLISTRTAHPKRLTVKNDETYEFVDIDSIDWAESANNYVQLHCGTKNYLMSETLNNLEKRLSPHGFVRVHRCHLVNTRRIVAVHPMLSGTFVLQLRNGVRIGTGRQYKDTIRDLLNI